MVDDVAALRVVETLVVDAGDAVHDADMAGLRQERRGRRRSPRGRAGC